MVVVVPERDDEKDMPEGDPGHGAGRREISSDPVNVVLITGVLAVTVVWLALLGVLLYKLLDAT
jgi:hypothetical protein